MKASPRVFDCSPIMRARANGRGSTTRSTGSRPFHGLIAVNLLLGNWDFKTSNNRVYRATGAGDGPATTLRRPGSRRDAGQAARASRFRSASRNDIDDFEDTTLIKSVRGSEVTLNYRGLRGEVLEVMSVADIVWACELMNRLRDAQLDDAFKAADYEPAIRTRFIKKIRAKIQEGLALRSSVRASTEGQE